MSGLMLLSEAQMLRIEPDFPLSHGVPLGDDRSAKREKKKRRVRRGPPEQTLPAVRRAVINAFTIPTARIRCPHCQQHFQCEDSILPKWGCG